MPDLLLVLFVCLNGALGQLSSIFLGKKNQEPQIISNSRTPHLEKYTTFSDAVVMHFNLPDNTVFASFKFVASEQDLSIFGCSTRNVSLYLKLGAPPVINPDGSKFPEEFKNISRSQIYNLEFYTDKKEAYINITSPEPGTYYVATFLAYEDPRYRKISQQGLTKNCRAYVDASVYVIKIRSPTIITDYQLVDVIGHSNQTRYFMFFVPDGLDHAIINVDSMNFTSATVDVILRVAPKRPPTPEVYTLEKRLNSSELPILVLLHTEPRTLYYISFDFSTNLTDNIEYHLTFTLRYYTNKLPNKPTFVAQNFGNTTLYNMSVTYKQFVSSKLTDVQPYRQFNLARESTEENFAFSYKLQPEVSTNMFVPLNVTSNEFTVLKFTLHRGTDIGGTLQYILAFKPRISRSRNSIQLVKEPDDHFVVGCIQKNNIAVPTWPRYCVSNEISLLAPIVLNETVTNSTVLIPYPESGVWYASFKLFCGICLPCDCPLMCQNDYERCTLECEMNCTSPFVEDCRNCQENCSTTILANQECSGCNCDGPCLRNSSQVCNSSVIYDVSSRPCYFGDCGNQGKCGLMVSEGVAYSSCLCTNNYRGFDCSDDALATPYYLVLIEFLLLILSNIFFLPAAYIAYKREYYVESMSYFSIFLSSSFYHACDAGENILSFCLFNLATLQFADFFSALLAIWLTLLAMGDLPQVHLSILQMAGSIVIAFCVTLNRYAFWIFAFPSCVGILIIFMSWFLKYRKYSISFIDKRYLYVKLPVGATVVLVGLIIYGLLQTQANYKYLHSLWHIIMATGVIFLLPTHGTFHTGTALT